MDNIPHEYKSLIRAKKDKILNSQGKEIVLSFKIDWDNRQIKTNSRPIAMTSGAGSEYMLMICHFGIFGRRVSISVGFQTKDLNICL